VFMLNEHQYDMLKTTHYPILLRSENFMQIARNP